MSIFRKALVRGSCDGVCGESTATNGQDCSCAASCGMEGNCCDDFCEYCPLTDVEGIQNGCDIPEGDPYQASNYCNTQCWFYAWECVQYGFTPGCSDVTACDYDPYNITDCNTPFYCDYGYECWDGSYECNPSDCPECITAAPPDTIQGRLFWRGDGNINSIVIEFNNFTGDDYAIAGLQFVLQSSTCFIEPVEITFGPIFDSFDFIYDYSIDENGDLFILLYTDCINHCGYPMASQFANEMEYPFGYTHTVISINNNGNWNFKDHPTYYNIVGGFNPEWYECIGDDVADIPMNWDPTDDIICGEEPITCCDDPSICTPHEVCSDACVCQWQTCFTAGTKIKMADGSEKNIEDVEVGDKLMGKTKNTIDVPETPWTIIISKVEKK